MTEPALFSLENQHRSRPLDLVSWGAGVESSAYLTEILTNPARHGVDLENLVVLHAVVGSEFTDTLTLSHIGNPGYQNMRSCPQTPILLLTEPGRGDRGSPARWSARGVCPRLF
jgi:hypothetical protein